MKSQFNLFCFEVQITKPDKYLLQIHPEGMNGDESPYSAHTATLVGAILAGWRLGRRFAKEERRAQSFVIYSLRDHLLGCDDLVFVGTISIRTSVKFFFN